MATAAAPQERVDETGGNLRRVITTPMLIIFVLGDILGAGSTPWSARSPARSVERSGRRSSLR